MCDAVSGAFCFSKGESMKVETYTLTTKTGRRIRKATRVIFPDGRKIEFTELMSKKQALKQALEVISHG